MDGIDSKFNVNEISSVVCISMPSRLFIRLSCSCSALHTTGFQFNAKPLSESSLWLNDGRDVILITTTKE